MFICLCTSGLSQEEFRCVHYDNKVLKLEDSKKRPRTNLYLRQQDLISDSVSFFFFLCASHSQAEKFGFWRVLFYMIMILIRGAFTRRRSDTSQLRTISRSFAIYKRHIWKRGVRTCFCAHVRFSLNLTYALLQNDLRTI